MVPIINPSAPVTFLTTDTAYGIEIDTTWGTDTAQVVSSTFNLYRYPEDTSVSPFTGQTVNFSQTETTSAFPYAWPSALGEAVQDVAWCSWIDSGGATGSTDGVLITVLAP